MPRLSVDVTRPISIEGLHAKVKFISKLTGLDFQFVPGTISNRRGYLLLAYGGLKESPFLPGNLIGRTRTEANRTLDAILAGIGFVAEIPPEVRPVQKTVLL